MVAKRATCQIRSTGVTFRLDALTVSYPRHHRFTPDQAIPAHHDTIFRPFDERKYPDKSPEYWPSFAKLVRWSMAREGITNEDPPLATGSATMDAGDDVACRRMVCRCGVEWRPVMKDNPYEPPSEYEPPSQRKPPSEYKPYWRRWKASTVTVSPFIALLLLVAVVTLIINLLAALRW